MAFEAATGDWTLVLDADEVLVAEDVELLRSLTGRTWREAFYVAETNYTGELDAGSAVTHNTLRMFRNRPQYRYRGRLHEQIADTLPGISARAHGVHQRAHRALRLPGGCARQPREVAAQHRAAAYAAGREPAHGLPALQPRRGVRRRRHPEAALAELERAWELLEADPDGETLQFAPALADRLVQLAASVRALRGRASPARRRRSSASPASPTWCSSRPPRTPRCTARSARSSYTSSASRWATPPAATPPRWAAAATCRGSPSASCASRAAKSSRRWSCWSTACASTPASSARCCPTPSALLGSGAAPEKVVRGGGAPHARSRPPRRASCWGPRCMRRGATTGRREAVPRRARAPAALQPGARGARRDAARAAALCGGGRGGVRDPHRGPARGDGLPQRAVRAHRRRRARRRGCRARARAGRGDGVRGDRPVRGLVSSWRAPGTARSRSRGEAWRCSGTILEALLRVQDFEVFEVAVALLERTPLSPRERREVLAELYLRRGFPASAAQEWMAVCQEQPDVRALYGLARVAERQGMHARGGATSRRQPSASSPRTGRDRAAASECAAAPRTPRGEARVSSGAKPPKAFHWGGRSRWTSQERGGPGTGPRRMRSGGKHSMSSPILPIQRPRHPGAQRIASGRSPERRWCAAHRRSFPARARAGSALPLET